MQQLDIFNDSRDRVLVNTLAEMIGRADLVQARAAAAALEVEFPADRHLPPAALLIDTLDTEALTRAQPLAGPDAALAARADLEGPVREAALALLGSAEAAPWLAARWLTLARRAKALPFDAARAPAHAASLSIAAGAWAEAEAAVAGIESWRRIPQPLAWMAQARWRLQGPDACWPLLAELAWMAPSRLPPLLHSLGDERLRKLQRRFEAFDTGADSAADASAEGNGDRAWTWWPAWLLVEQPLMAAPLGLAQTAADTAPERCFQCLQSLLRLERQGRHHDIVALRRELQGLHPGLFSAYMSTR